jgi:amidase
VTLFAEGVDHWLETFRPLQLYDLWCTLGAWGKTPGRTLSPAVEERIELSSHVDPAKYAAAVLRRESLTDRLTALLGNDGVLVIPTAHDLPPFRNAPVSAQIEFREKTLALTCVASLCRLPQINIPAVRVDGCPVGLSFIAGPRGDQLLLALAENIGQALPVASLGQ